MSEFGGSAARDAASEDDAPSDEDEGASRSRLKTGIQWALQAAALGLGVASAVYLSDWDIVRAGLAFIGAILLTAAAIVV